jgi:hypothetical protein
MPPVGATSKLLLLQLAGAAACYAVFRFSMPLPVPARFAVLEALLLGLAYGFIRLILQRERERSQAVDRSLSAAGIVPNGVLIDLARKLRAGEPDAQVAASLTAQGVPKGTAELLLQRARAMANPPYLAGPAPRSDGLWHLLLAASTALLAWGAIGFNLWLAGAGLVGWLVSQEWAERAWVRAGRPD